MTPSFAWAVSNKESKSIPSTVEPSPTRRMFAFISFGENPLPTKFPLRFRLDEIFAMGEILKFLEMKLMSYSAIGFSKSILTSEEIFPVLVERRTLDLKFNGRPSNVNESIFKVRRDCQIIHIINVSNYSFSFEMRFFIIQDNFIYI